MRAIDIGKAAVVANVNPGPAPMLQWLKIADLVIDDTYQRELRRDGWTNVRKIADRFRWSKFSPVFVAPVEGGKYAVIDGQHRTHAATLCGFEEVPCQIVQMTREEQAASFAAVNGLVTKVTPWNILKAAIAAGEGWALDCAKVCSEAGCTLMTHNSPTDSKQPGQIYSLALIRKLVRDGHGKVLRTTLSALRQSEFGGTYEAYSAEILKPLLTAAVERPWIKGGADLTSWFDAYDIWATIDRAAEFVKVKRRQGHVGISKYDIASAEIGEALDKAFPQRMALPAA